MVKRIRLQKRDEKILEHIKRFRMTTAETLHGEFFDGKGEDAVTSTIRRLRAAQYIVSADLGPPNRRYYHLTAKSTRLLGLPSSFSCSLGEQALPIRHAILRFCCTGEDRHLLMPSEFSEEFPSCQEKRIPKEPYYLDSKNGVTRLSFLMPDLGAEAGRIVRKCRRAFSVRREIEGFKTLIQGDAFSVTVLTARNSKRDAIIAALKRAESFSDPVSVVVVPDMIL